MVITVMPVRVCHLGVVRLLSPVDRPFHELSDQSMAARFSVRCVGLHVPTMVV